MRNPELMDLLLWIMIIGGYALSAWIWLGSFGRQFDANGRHARRLPPIVILLPRGVRQPPQRRTIAMRRAG